MLLALALLLGGRLLRRRLLLGPDGRWRDDLWCADLLAGDEPAAEPARAPRPTLTAPLPVNTCGEDSLTLLPGVGPVLAARIVASRRAEGPFRGPDDLRRVRGIGPATAARLAPLLVFAPDSAAAGKSP